MNWKALKTEEDYNKASLRLMEIFHVEPNAPEFDELDLLIILIKDYDDRHYPVPELDALDEALDEALDDVANGRVHSHEQAMAKIKSRFPKYFK